MICPSRLFGGGAHIKKRTIEPFIFEVVLCGDTLDVPGHFRDASERCLSITRERLIAALEVKRRA